MTGVARYTADQPAENLLYAVLVTAAIPAGRVTAIDSTKAVREHGVVRVLTHADMPRLAKLDAPPIAQSFMPLQRDEIRFDGQPIALVLADTLEAAEAGARSVVVSYETSKARLPASLEWATLDRSPSRHEKPVSVHGAGVFKG